MNTKFCSNCGAKIPRNSNFCEQCGADQNAGNPQRVVIDNYNNNSSGNKQVIGSSNPVNVYQSFKLFWNNFSNFGGVSSRSEYWLWMSVQFINVFL